MREIIAFDEAASRRVERLYLTPDVVSQRAEVLGELELELGESVLDIGVGPGAQSPKTPASTRRRGWSNAISLFESSFE